MHSYALRICDYHACVNDALSTEYVHRELVRRSQDVFVLVQPPYGQKTRNPCFDGNYEVAAALLWSNNSSDLLIILTPAHPKLDGWLNHWGGWSSPPIKSTTYVLPAKTPFAENLFSEVRQLHFPTFPHRFLSFSPYDPPFASVQDDDSTGKIPLSPPLVQVIAEITPDIVPFLFSFVSKK